MFYIQCRGGEMKSIYIAILLGSVVSIQPATAQERVPNGEGLTMEQMLLLPRRDGPIIYPRPLPTDYVPFEDLRANEWNRPGLSRDPVAAINAARQRVRATLLQRHPILDAAAQKSMEIYLQTGAYHVLRESDVAALGWNVNGPLYPGYDPRRRWAHNWSEAVGCSEGYLNNLLKNMVEMRYILPEEAHAWDMMVANWTHVGYAETGDGKVCVWMGYIPDK
jgi:hypothetical protein